MTKQKIQHHDLVRRITDGFKNAYMTTCRTVSVRRLRDVDDSLFPRDEVENPVDTFASVFRPAGATMFTIMRMAESTHATRYLSVLPCMRKYAIMNSISPCDVDMMIILGSQILIPAVSLY